MEMPVWIVLLVTLLLLTLGGVLTIAAAWMRWGTSRAARWWVVRRMVDSRWAVTSERVALVLLPLLAQTMLVAGLIVPTVAILAGLGMPSAVTNGVMIVAAVVEVVIWLVATLPTAHEAIFPMYIYPRWLRAQRAADRDRFATEARQKRELRRQLRIRSMCPRMASAQIASVPCLSMRRCVLVLHVTCYVTRSTARVNVPASSRPGRGECPAGPRGGTQTSSCGSAAAEGTPE